MPKNNYIKLRKIALILLCFIYIAFYPRPAELYNLDLFCSGKVLFYTNRLPDDLSGCAVLHNGINYQITTDILYAQHVREKIEVTYQTVIFSGSLDYVKRYFNMQRTKSVNLNGGVLLSGYCSMVKGGRLKNGKNIQIYFKDNLVYVGNPIIFGSY